MPIGARPKHYNLFQGFVKGAGGDENKFRRTVSRAMDKAETDYGSSSGEGARRSLKAADKTMDRMVNRIGGAGTSSKLKALSKALSEKSMVLEAVNPRKISQAARNFGVKRGGTKKYDA